MNELHKVKIKRGIDNQILVIRSFVDGSDIIIQD